MMAEMQRKLAARFVKLDCELYRFIPDELAKWLRGFSDVRVTMTVINFHPNLLKIAENSRGIS